MSADHRAFEEAIMARLCAFCVECRDDGGCGLDPSQECSIKIHLPQILQSVQGVTSDRIEDYVEHIRQDVCAVCEERNPDGSCDVRARIDCPLDRYLVLVVEAIEDLRQRNDRDGLASSG
ncbi:MAG: hypothetical protein V3S01_13425 [Dehalococcoidia bacterium]